MRLQKRIERLLLRRLLPIPVRARHAEYSVIASADDDPSRPTPRLISLAMEAIRRARDISLESLQVGRPAGSLAVIQVWPGEHYRLLRGLSAALNPQWVVEIGTGGGVGTLCLREGLAPEGQVATFDLIGWREHGDSILQERDFSEGRMVQYVEDLSRPEVFSRFRPLLEKADLIFVDAAKDGVMEQRLLDLFETARFLRPPLLVFDDIRVWNMLRIWRGIRRPKLDLTSFGHWTGTGLVDWC